MEAAGILYIFVNIADLPHTQFTVIYFIFNVTVSRYNEV
jgi:hypothetical protein